MRKPKKRINYRSQTTVRRAYTPSMSPINRMLIGLLIVVGVITLTQLFISNYFSTKGTDLAELLAQKESLREENDILKSRLARMTSLVHIASEAQKQGLTAAQRIVFLPDQTPKPNVALRNE